MLQLRFYHQANTCLLALFTMLSVWPSALTHPLIRPRALESGKGSRADDGRGRRECAQPEMVDRGVLKVLKQLDPQSRGCSLGSIFQTFFKSKFPSNSL